MSASKKTEAGAELTPAQASLLDDIVDHMFALAQVAGKRANEIAASEGVAMSVEDRKIWETAHGFDRDRFVELQKQELRESLITCVAGLSDQEIAKRREDLLDFKSQHPVATLCGYDKIST